ncbi:hypothetical protein BABINDRAFT_162555 [Babjeviella inositovora NRRL Y-12698]|uniref:SAM domain-containing protein n=1 Tax=Babjeviella inositovora NRRL Y-12698 TaxID=984486 RepID=A0A1E3QPI2_9ASCO|nr:uncharacterized protein BABINDRAFT_162555 [Babjeviella inositovora NRRL Y-12698]ODQ78887.1 hypothetical protein BABINDRAFT_162555 [Babjeviella inositovora NRRL Y-12698]
MHSLLSPGSNIQRPHSSLANAQSFLSPSATPLPAPMSHMSDMNAIQANLASMELDPYPVPGELDEFRQDAYPINVCAPTPTSHTPTLGAARFTGFAEAPLMDRILSPALMHNPIYGEMPRLASAQDNYSFQASIKFNQDLTNVQQWVERLSLNEQYIYVDNFLSVVSEEVLVYARNQISNKLAAQPLPQGYAFEPEANIDSVLSSNWLNRAVSPDPVARPRSADMFHQSPQLLSEMSNFLTSRAMELTSPSHGKAAGSNDMHLNAQQLKMSALQTVSSRAQMDSSKKDELVGAATGNGYGRGRQSHLNPRAVNASSSVPASARGTYFESGYVSPPPTQRTNRSRNRSSGAAPQAGSNLSFSAMPDAHEPELEAKPTMPLEISQLKFLADIPVWLRSLRLHKYADNLKDIPWATLIYLDDAALEARGVGALGARRKLLKAFEFVKETRGLSDDPAEVHIGPVDVDSM